MNLPFFSKKTIHSDNYLGLFLQENKVTGYVYELDGKRIKILAEHSAEYSNNFENILEDVDNLLFRLETDSNKKLKKTIFFLSSFFIDIETKEIRREQKHVIKSLVKQLELDPLGFIECYEAVAALLTKKENMPLSAILVELDKNIASVFVYRNGKQMQTRTFKRTSGLIGDLSTVFAELNGVSRLPARIILYPFKESHRELVHLINHKWDEEVFVQIPRIEAFSEEDFSTALSEIFASQMMDEVPSVTATTAEMPEQEHLPEKEVTEAEVEQHLEDLAEKKGEVSSPPVPSEAPKQVMGFMVGKDVTEGAESTNMDLEQRFEEEREKEEETGEDVQDEVEEPKEAVISQPKKKGGAKIPVFAMPRLQFKALPVIIGVAVIAIALLFFGAEYFFHKAVVTVVFPSKEVMKELEVTEDDIAIKTGSISAEVNESKSTTGKRDIGEKAHGEVTISNFDDKDKTIGKGTILTANNKEFTLDQEVKVASASFNTDNTAKLPGKAKGSITASTIGPDSNLDKGTKFLVQGLSSSLFFGINDSALTGGSKRQVQTVAKVDLDALKTKALEEGKQQGLDQLREKTSAEQQLISDLTTQELAETDFSKEVGDEASQLSLKATINTTYYSYSASEMKKFLQKALDTETPAGFILPQEKVSYTIKKATNTTGIKLDVESKGTALKQVAREDIDKDLTGKSSQKVEEILKSKYGAKDYKITNKGISLFPWMPMFKNNIEINVSSN
jgi:hypothetical protein